MGDAIGQVLPLVVGAALSPLLTIDGTVCAASGHGPGLARPRRAGLAPHSSARHSRTG